MAEVAIAAPGDGEVIGDSPDRRVEILVDIPELTVTWSRFGPGRDGADRHIHYNHADLFYVLEGKLALKIEDEAERGAPAGTLVYVPPMVIHGFRNAFDDADVKYLNLHAPGCGFADYMRAIRDGADTAWFDQFDPEGVEGIRPASEIQIAFGDGTLVEADEISVSVTSGEAGDGSLRLPVGDGRILAIRVPGSGP